MFPTIKQKELFHKYNNAEENFSFNSTTIAQREKTHTLIYKTENSNNIKNRNCLKQNILATKEINI